MNCTLLQHVIPRQSPLENGVSYQWVVNANDQYSIDIGDGFGTFTVSPIVHEARLDIGMPYNTFRGCPSNFVGCGKPYHGFASGVCTDLVLDAYTAGIAFNMQNALLQDKQANPSHYYRWSDVRNANDMRLYFAHTGQWLSPGQAYQVGDIAFFDWGGDGITDHVLIISQVDANGRPLAMVDESGSIPGLHPASTAWEHY